MTNFRVHLSDGSKIDMAASTAADATRQAIGRYPDRLVTKVKVVRTK